MDVLAEFLRMGGYAPFVWPAYGVAAAVLIGLLVQSRRRLTRAERALERLERTEPDGERAGGPAAGSRP